MKQNGTKFGTYTYRILQQIFLPFLIVAFGLSAFFKDSFLDKKQIDMLLAILGYNALTMGKIKIMWQYIWTKLTDAPFSSFEFIVRDTTMSIMFENEINDAVVRRNAAENAVDELEIDLREVAIIDAEGNVVAAWIISIVFRLSHPFKKTQKNIQSKLFSFTKSTIRVSFDF